MIVSTGRLGDRLCELCGYTHNKDGQLKETQISVNALSAKMNVCKDGCDNN